jgi:hypothetical protein
MEEFDRLPFPQSAAEHQETSMSTVARAPYTQEISRSTPAFFLFVLDQSYSMEEPLGGDRSKRKCDELCLVINGWLQNMIIKASGDKGIKDWMDVGVIGYRTDNEENPIIVSCLPGVLGETAYANISKINDHAARTEERMQRMYDDETGEEMEFPVTVPVWVDPVAEGGTPMCAVLDYCYTILEHWISEHRDCFPPIVVHITDGESQDGDPIPAAERVKGLATDNGNVLLFNCHLSMTAADPVVFPSSDEILPEELARVLFRMSSVLPEPMFQRAVQEGFAIQPKARGMVFNANMISLLQFLDMGTRIAKNLR